MVKTDLEEMDVKNGFFVAENKGNNTIHAESTSNFLSLAGAYFQTDFGPIFTIPLPLFMGLKRFLVKALHLNTNRMMKN